MFKNFFRKLAGRRRSGAEAAPSLSGRTGARARQLYEDRAGCCAEVVLLAINETCGGGLGEDDVLRLTGGFCGGIGNSGNTCGALNGAVMGLGLFLGRRSRMDRRSSENEAAAKTLVEEFEKSHGHLLCRELTTGLPRSARKEHCAGITARTAALAARIIQEHTIPLPAPVALAPRPAGAGGGDVRGNGVFRRGSGREDEIAALCAKPLVVEDFSTLSRDAAHKREQL